MNLDKLYKMQEELDNHIWSKHKTLEKMSKEELLDNTILALLVEVGELANATRCFKHWSVKGMMDEEIVLDELADVYHFYLSIGNQLNYQINKFPVLDEGLWQALEDEDVKMLDVLLSMYRNIAELEIFKDRNSYISIGQDIYVLGILLRFNKVKIEQAYLKKHEENYHRQEEGY